MLDHHWFQANPDPTGFFNADQGPKPKEKYANKFNKKCVIKFFIKKTKLLYFLGQIFKNFSFIFRNTRFLLIYAIQTQIFCTKQWSDPDPKFYLGLRSGKIKRIRIRLKRTPRMAIFFCDVLTLPHVKHLMGMIIFVFISYWSETEFLVLKMYGKYDNKDERWMYWEPRKISQAVELSVQGYEDSQQIYSHTIYTVS